MVILDQNFDAVEIYEAQRPAVVGGRTVPRSKARNEAGAMEVSKHSGRSVVSAGAEGC
jgi:hypothetical protein